MAWTSSGTSNGCLIGFGFGKFEGLDLFVIFLPPIQTLLRIRYIPFTAMALPYGSSIPRRTIAPPPSNTAQEWPKEHDIELKINLASKGPRSLASVGHTERNPFHGGPTLQSTGLKDLLSMC